MSTLYWAEKHQIQEKRGESEEIHFLLCPSKTYDDFSKE